MIDEQRVRLLGEVMRRLFDAGILDRPTFGTLLDNALMASVFELGPGDAVPWFNNPPPSNSMRRFHRSEAVERAIETDDVTVRIMKEHVVPRASLYREFRGGARIEDIAAVWRVAFITRDEDIELNDAGLRSRMPADWQLAGSTGWERYEHVGLRGRLLDPIPRRPII